VRAIEARDVVRIESQGAAPNLKGPQAPDVVTGRC
jgi:hypothetical protein